jgi:EpsI family protein
MIQLLRSRYALVLSLVLIGEIGAFYVFPKSEYVPAFRPLKELPAVIGAWQMAAEYPMDSEIQELLKADDTVNRAYVNDAGVAANLYIAFFKTQRSGVSPHSPKVCLPGSGWTPSPSSTREIAIEGQAEPISVNRYIVSRGDNTSVVLYWYQTPKRVVANEYAAKVFTVLDSIRYRRSDTSMIRVTVPVGPDGLERAEQDATQLVQQAFNPIRNLLPN